MNKKLYGTATVGTKGQVVIPVDAREELGMKAGDRLYVMGGAHGGAIVFLKEEMLEGIIGNLTEQIEGIRALEAKKNKK